VPPQIGLARGVGYFLLFDLLFLPYFQLVIVPYGLPLLMFAAVVLNARVCRDSYLTLFIVIAAAAALSIAGSAFAPQAELYLPENLKRGVQLLTSFGYFFYFRWLARRAEIRPERLVGWFLVWFAVLAVIFFFDPAGTGDMIRRFYGRLVTSEETLAAHLRFSYMFTDPNTAAYFFLIGVSPLLARKHSPLVFLALSAALAILTFITQSRGALIALVLMLLLTVYPPAHLRTIFSARRAVGLLVVALAIFGAFAYLIDTAGSAQVVKLAYERIFEASDQYESGGSRFQIWSHFTSNLFPLPLGRGYSLILEGVSDRPHSDLLRFVYAYGFPAAIAAVVFFFRRLLSFPALVIPALTAFLINTLADEQKLLGLYLALLGIAIGSGERREPAVRTEDESK
jgi:hypothetical protein